MHSPRNVFAFLAIAIQLVAISTALPQGFPGRLGSDPCTRGPAHWCASLENILECGTGAYEHCQREKQQQNNPILVGQDKCTFGPSYWCQSIDTILECGNGAYDHCRNNRKDGPVTIRPPPPRPVTIPPPNVGVVGSNPCTFGPSHWCQSMTNAIQCGSGAFEHCTRQNQQINSAPAPGSDPCTFSPSAICQDFNLVSRCGVTFELCSRFVGSPAPGSSLGSAPGSGLGSAPLLAVG